MIDNLDLSRGLTTETINDLIEAQLAVWPEARTNFFRLQEAERKPLKLGDLDAAVQYNPARIRSTGAKVDPKSVAARPCFLCAENRPKEQFAVGFGEGWQLLVNPFPILPVHFTVVSTEHRPQDEIPLEMASMAEKAPDLAFFFNGARAGASAPDHLHVQAVLSSELPLLRLAEKHHPASRGGFMKSEETGLDLPFSWISAVVTPDPEGMLTLATIPTICGTDPETGKPDRGLVNAFFWMGREGLLRALVIPRRAHRPQCYPEMMISPGAIDMAGLLISPRKEDFDRLDADTAAQIYADTGLK